MNRKVIRKAFTMKLTEEQKEELSAAQEVSTYLTGLRDALEMTKAELRASIEFLENEE